jgi:hypothetical protein
MLNTATSVLLITLGLLVLLSWGAWAAYSAHEGERRAASWSLAIAAATGIPLLAAGWLLAAAARLYLLPLLSLNPVRPRSLPSTTMTCQKHHSSFS